MKSREDLMREFRRCEGRFNEIYFQHGRTNPREHSLFPQEFHPGVDLWLSGMEGLQRTLEWGLGRAIFCEAFYTLTFETLLSLRLDGWNEDWAYLPWNKPLTFEYAKVPTHALCQAADMGIILTRAVAVQNRVLIIEKIHPGKWHPMFHGRVKKWLVNVENIVRAAEWILGKRSDADTFYLLDETSMGQLDKARHGGVVPYSSGAIRRIDQLVGFDLGAQDHKPEDFQS